MTMREWLDEHYTDKNYKLSDNQREKIASFLEIVADNLIEEVLNPTA